MDQSLYVFQELPAQQRADAVSSLVYEANARIRDPVYGCVGAISYLQQQVSQLQMQLAVAEEALPPMADRFGWCMWDYFYLTVDPPASGKASPSSLVPACRLGSSSLTMAGRA